MNVQCMFIYFTLDLKCNNASKIITSKFFFFSNIFNFWKKGQREGQMGSILFRIFNWILKDFCNLHKAFIYYTPQF